MEKNIILLNSYKKDIIEYIPKIGISFLIIIFFFIIAIVLKKFILSENNNPNDTNKENKKILNNFLSIFIYYLIIFLGIFFAISNLGFNLNTLFIFFGSIGLAIALAIQSTFTQLVAGLIILYFNYFDTGDLIQLNTTLGFIESFNLLNTTIYDNRGVKTIIPNNNITNGNFTNYYKKDKIYVHFNVKLSNNNIINYDILLDNIKNALIKECTYVVDKNNVFVLVFDMSTYGTELLIRLLIKNTDYFKALFSAQLIVRKVLANDNVLLLDNAYLETPNHMS